MPDCAVSRIARHQLSLYVHDWRVLMVAALLLCLYGLSLWSGWLEVASARKASARLDREERQRC
jgi:hypothetical protein